MIRIGLTGGIGAGKSSVSGRLDALGATVLDADAISRSLLVPDSACGNEVLALFGDGVLTDEGQFDRRKIAELVFNDNQKRTALNGIIHPRVLERMQSLATQAPRDSVVIFDVPLLIESGFHRNVDHVAVVTAADTLRIQRIMARDCCTMDQALARITMQIPQEEQILHAHDIIQNDTDLEALYRQTDALYQKWQNMSRA